MDDNSLSPLDRSHRLESRMCSVFDSNEFDTQHSYAISKLSYFNVEWHKNFL